MFPSGTWWRENDGPHQYNLIERQVQFTERVSELEVLVDPRGVEEARHVGLGAALGAVVAHGDAEPLVEQHVTAEEPELEVPSWQHNVWGENMRILWMIRSLNIRIII